MSDTSERFLVCNHEERNGSNLPHMGDALVNAFHGSQNVMNVLMKSVICMSFVMNGSSQGFSLLYSHMADD